MLNADVTRYQGCKSPSNSNSIDYQDAIQLVHKSAVVAKHGIRKNDIEKVPLTSSLGRIVAEDIVAPYSTPSADTSAMDGYAVCSEITQDASPQKPIVLHIVGCITAGQSSTIFAPVETHDGCWPCVEIATGAKFPAADLSHGGSKQRVLDAVVPYEQVSYIENPSSSVKYIQINRPVRENQHRRFAGSDISKGSIVLREGVVIQPQQIMALASIGTQYILVRKKLRVGIWSTGDELMSQQTPKQTESETSESNESRPVFDSNGPFLVSALQNSGVEVSFLGAVGDDGVDLQRELQLAVNSNAYDLLLTTGAVSMGKHDFVRSVIEKAGANIIFHKSKIRPGHPLLHATLARSQASGSNTQPQSMTHVGFFGLPGNPVAAAVGYRFFVIPYLRCLQGLPKEEPQKAIVQFSIHPVCSSASHQQKLKMSTPGHVDIFWHGQMVQTSYGLRFIISPEQSPSKVKPFSQANAWVHIPKGYGDISEGIELNSFPLMAP